MIPSAQLARVRERYAALEAELAANPAGQRMVQLLRERAQLEPVVSAIDALGRLQGELDEAEGMMLSADRAMAALALEERDRLRGLLPEAERTLKLLLLPRDAADAGSAILEIRAGAGGDEAALFAGDLFRMYQRHASLQGWRIETLSLSESDLGGFKEVIASVAGQGVYGQLKYESGVHRVQRVPATEAQGRIHTSTATVAVLPEPEDIDVHVNEADLRIDVFRASGAGGQHVNKTESAVRIMHVPSGIVVACQDEKSQHKNKAQALKILKARLFDAERERAETARAAERLSQVGTGDRSERIRTYNFPQGRVTDHRINLTLYDLDRVVAGDGLAKLIDALQAEDQAKKLAALDARAA